MEQEIVTDEKGKVVSKKTHKKSGTESQGEEEEKKTEKYNEEILQKG